MLGTCKSHWTDRKVISAINGKRGLTIAFIRADAVCITGGHVDVDVIGVNEKICVVRIAHPNEDPDRRPEQPLGLPSRSSRRSTDQDAVRKADSIRTELAPRFRGGRRGEA